MKFHRCVIADKTTEKGILLEWWSSEHRQYRVHKSLNGPHWLAFVRVTEDYQYSLVGPPQETKEAAIALCEEHSLDLPW